MNVEQHRMKGRRIVEGLDKLDPITDTFAVIDGTMVAGYHIGNALLHVHGASSDETHWNTPSKLEITIEHLAPAVTSGFALFAELEDLRQRYVRNADAPDAAAAKEAMRLVHAMAALM
jgi:hypothetical protein